MLTEPRSDCDEIEVTPEMIEAGTEVCAKTDMECATLAELLRDLFRAMTRAHSGFSSRK
jgi:hypothetical protein